MKKYKIGYTQGTFDMFHIGHLNLIKHAKEYCEYLIVGVNSDRLVENYKHKNAVIPEQERAEIVGSIKGVDRCFIVDTLDKLTILEKVPYDAIFIGDDWKGKFDFLKEEGVEVVYLPRTPEISSSQIKKDLYDANAVDGESKLNHSVINTDPS